MGHLEPPTVLRRAPAARHRVRRAAALLAAAVLALAPLTAGAGPAGADGTPAAPPAPIGPVNYVVAVDESGSIQPDEMAQEKDAALRIALGDVSPASTVAVLGFASSNTPDQHAVDVVCPPTALDTAGRDNLGGCAGQLRGRQQSEGWDTDFPAAVSQAVSLLTTNTDPTTPRVLFLLTDGKLDVPNSPQYGDQAHRQQNAQQALVTELQHAADAKVQVRPLGFGSDADQNELNLMAASGYQNGCVDLPDAKPRATLVPDSAAVGAALQTAFAAAHCLQSTTGTSGHPPVDLSVRISPLATVGSIVVDKGDPAVTATYYDPQGHQITGTGDAYGSHFELAGQGQSVESLRITDPAPGTWRIHLDAPDGHRGQLATVSVLWHGELRSSITMDPPSPAAGAPVTVTVRLQTRDGFAVTDQQDLQQLGITAQLTGDGFSPVPIPLTDAVPGTRNGSFTGKVTVPTGATGRLNVTETLTSPGLTADQDRAEGSMVAPPVNLLSAALTPPTGSAHPGDHLTATLAVHNGDQVPHTLALRAEDLAGGLLTPSPAQVTVAPGSSPVFRIALLVGSRVAFGRQLDGGSARLGGKLVVLDTTDQGRPLADPSIALTVTPRPSFVQQYQWYLLAGALLLTALLLAATAVFRHGAISRRPVGLVLVLRDAEGQEVVRRAARNGPHGWFEFDILEPRSPFPQIVNRTGGAYRVQRHRDGGAVLEERGRPGGRVLPGQPVALANGLALDLAESRSAAPPPIDTDEGLL
ncbi:vWA domain-containing protein [Kitasatospora viridis]|uniref:von Willebrand factor type A domain-containing protein n=1 Tax=Kitasatospora viridis TaxID=281105 RepID=A0A561SFG2_9ACTN|nr:vWA domain-containing protein [Kitasatospora viridis]TWF73606.1 von Willebrand factor type A domain-containing protein [Kitasatospora viridis]